jgi:hypothetical protein
MEKDQLRFQVGLEQVAQSQLRMEEGQHRLEEKLDHFKMETRSELKYVQSQLDENEGLFERVSGKISETDVEVAHLLQKSKAQEVKISHLEREAGSSPE